MTAISTTTATATATALILFAISAAICMAILCNIVLFAFTKRTFIKVRHENVMGMTAFVFTALGAVLLSHWIMAIAAASVAVLHAFTPNRDPNRE